MDLFKLIQELTLEKQLIDRAIAELEAFQEAESATSEKKRRGSQANEAGTPFRR